LIPIRWYIIELLWSTILIPSHSSPVVDERNVPSLEIIPPIKEHHAVVDGDSVFLLLSP
jgi:hypothetical protein